MVFEKRDDLLIALRFLEIPHAEIARLLSVGVSSVSQKLGGLCELRASEEKLIADYINKRIERVEQLPAGHTLREALAITAAEAEAACSTPSATVDHSAGQAADAGALGAQGLGDADQTISHDPDQSANPASENTGAPNA